jgi:hypothetical protein
VGVAAAIVAAIVVIFIPEVPMRATFEMQETGTGRDAAPA